MKNKCTLLIDGNWLLQSRFSILEKGFRMNVSTDAKQDTSNSLCDLMAKSISVILNRFPMIDNMILVTDGGSWRKNIEKPSSRKNIEYKGNRETDEKYDWKYIWSALKQLSNNFAKNNITYSCYKDIEGDDWIWYWTQKLNKDGINCIIWSSDNDLKQLVNSDTNTGAFTMWYNDKCGGVLPLSLCPSDNDIEFFLSPIIVNPTLEAIKNKLKQKISYIYPSDIILGKIMCGDAGDNIKPVASYELNGRTYGLTPKMWNDISKQTNIVSIQGLLGNEEIAALCISDYKKFKSANVSKQNILENIKYNTQLVWLNEHIIPKDILQIMYNQEYKTIDINQYRINYKLLCNVNSTIDNLIDEVENLFE